MNIAEEIVTRITMNDIFSMYGFSADRKGNICCPFHNEKDPSLGQYSNGKKWHCFGCNEGGSVIDFVMKLYNISFKQAIMKIDYDFNLGISGRKLSHSERQKLKQEERARKRQAEEAKRIAAEKDAFYKKILDMWVKNEEITRRYKGTSKCAFDYPKEYWSALLHRQFAAYILDSIER